MSSVVQCKCGTKVRLPVERRGKELRCPKCKSALAAPSELAVRALTIDAPGGTICPICQTQIQQAEACVSCPSCQQIHHQECWSEIGGCGSYGCNESPAIDKSEHSVQSPLAAWGDTKKCPACGETIKSIALRCRYCSTDFGSVDPLTVDDLRQHAIKSEKTQRFKQIVVGNFGLSLIGVLAPICLVFGLVYLLPKRQQLTNCGPIFVIMGWASIGLSSLYCLLLLMFLLAGVLG